MYFSCKAVRRMHNRSCPILDVHNTPLCLTDSVNLQSLENFAGWSRFECNGRLQTPHAFTEGNHRV